MCVCAAQCLTVFLSDSTVKESHLSLSLRSPVDCCCAYRLPPVKQYVNFALKHVGHISCAEGFPDDCRRWLYFIGGLQDI